MGADSNTTNETRICTAGTHTQIDEPFCCSCLDTRCGEDSMSRVNTVHSNEVSQLPGQVDANRLYTEEFGAWKSYRCTLVATSVFIRVCGLIVPIHEVCHLQRQHTCVLKANTHAKSKRPMEGCGGSRVNLPLTRIGVNELIFLHLPSEVSHCA